MQREAELRQSLNAANKEVRQLRKCAEAADAALAAKEAQLAELAALGEERGRGRRGGPEQALAALVAVSVLVVAGFGAMATLRKAQ